MLVSKETVLRNIQRNKQHNMERVAVTVQRTSVNLVDVLLALLCCVTRYKVRSPFGITSNIFAV